MGSVVKNTYYSSRGSKFSIASVSGRLQESATSAPIVSDTYNLHEHMH